MLQILEILTLVISGWLAGAESGSWSCVHPVIEKLKPEDQIVFSERITQNVWENYARINAS